MTTISVPRDWQQQLQYFFRRMSVELFIGGLIVTSVALTLLELSLPETELRSTLIEVNYGITCLFAMELTLRFAAQPSWQFFRKYAIDLISILPLLRMLPFARLLRLFRLLRILRLLGIFSRYASSFPYIFRRGAIEYVIVSGLILLTVLFSTGALLTVEKDNEDVNTFGEALWYSIYTLLSGEPISGPPKTIAGHLVVVGVMFMGMTVFAMFTGTVSAFMVERLSKEGRIVRWEDFNDHIVICGWNRKAEIIVLEYRVAERNRESPIVVVAEFDEEPEVTDPRLSSRVQFLNDDFTKVSVLEKAGIHRAKTCIILSDMAHHRSEQDADARTILAALTVEKLNPHVYTCAELNNRDYGSHLEMGGVNDFVVTGEHSGFLLAQAALNRGLMGVFSELLTHERGNQFYRLPLPDEWVGRSFFDLFMHLKQTRNAILVAVYDAKGFHINPQDFEFAGGEHIIVISEVHIDL